MTSPHVFTTETAGLPHVARPSVVRLYDGDHLDLGITPVRMVLDDANLRMLAYNGSIPGPTLHVDQGSAITVHVTNYGDVETTVHWHGLRLENRYDGVPHDTQEPIPVGRSFSYTLEFPDAGFYWYHPHLREDFAQDMGLYGTIIVEPTDPSYWPPVDRYLTFTLDDLLVENGQMAPFNRSGPTFVAMGRFGNVLLINGETSFAGAAALGEVVRLHLVNTANTRIFNFAARGARMKLVGGDSGRYERESFVDEVLLAPSERAVVDLLFNDPEHEVRLEHRTPDRVYDLGGFTVASASRGSAGPSYAVLRTDPELTAEHASLGPDLERPPDKVLAFVSRMPLLYGDEAGGHETGGHEAGGHEAGGHEAGGHEAGGHEAWGHEAGGHEAGGPEVGGHEHGDGLEWEDLMPEINRASDPSNMIWELVDRANGAINHAISWDFTVGDRVKIRLVNEMDSDHPMHHPFHIHGAGRFLILARDDQPEQNLVWKDTVLLRAGETVDILLDVSNPGLWMAHCHIAEHAESGMMFSFTVARRT